MKSLPKPTIKTKSEDIFEECVKSYIDTEKRNKLLTCKSIIQLDSTSYDELIPDKIDKFSQSILPKNVKKVDLTDVYDKKFANKDGPGRKYYDQIKNSVFRGICPICGIRMISTLDHYLPKSKVPTLSVTPNNLIPSCRDCNMDKRSAISFNPSEIPVHLYFDEIPLEPFLFVKLGDNLEALYYIECPISCDDDLKSRINNHLEHYNLHSLYSSHAAQEISDEISLWKILFTQTDSEKLKKYMESKKESAESNDINSWKSALYRALLLEFDKVITYLENN